LTLLFLLKDKFCKSWWFYTAPFVCFSTLTRLAKYFYDRFNNFRPNQQIELGLINSGFKSPGFFHKPNRLKEKAFIIPTGAQVQPKS
jgi:hypothetical protein